MEEKYNNLSNQELKFCLEDKDRVIEMMRLNIKVLSYKLDEIADKYPATDKEISDFFNDLLEQIHWATEKTLKYKSYELKKRKQKLNEVKE